MQKAHKKVFDELCKLAKVPLEYVGPTGSGHFKVRDDMGNQYFAPSTPSDHRSIQNKAALIRRTRRQSE